MPISSVRCGFHIEDVGKKERSRRDHAQRKQKMGAPQKARLSEQSERANGKELALENVIFDRNPNYFLASPGKTWKQRKRPGREQQGCR